MSCCDSCAETGAECPSVTRARFAARFGRSRLRGEWDATAGAAIHGDKRGVAVTAAGVGGRKVGEAYGGPVGGEVGQYAGEYSGGKLYDLAASGGGSCPGNAMCDFATVEEWAQEAIKRGAPPGDVVAAVDAANAIMADVVQKSPEMMRKQLSQVINTNIPGLKNGTQIRLARAIAISDVVGKYPPVGKLDLSKWSNDPNAGRTIDQMAMNAELDGNGPELDADGEVASAVVVGGLGIASLAFGLVTTGLMGVGIWYLWKSSGKKPRRNPRKRRRR